MLASLYCLSWIWWRYSIIDALSMSWIVASLSFNISFVAFVLVWNCFNKHLHASCGSRIPAITWYKISFMDNAMVVTTFIYFCSNILCPIASLSIRLITLGFVNLQRLFVVKMFSILNFRALKFGTPFNLFALDIGLGLSHFDKIGNKFHELKKLLIWMQMERL